MENFSFLFVMVIKVALDMVLIFIILVVEGISEIAVYFILGQKLQNSQNKILNITTFPNINIILIFFKNSEIPRISPGGSEIGLGI